MGIHQMTHRSKNDQTDFLRKWDFTLLHTEKLKSESF